MTKSIYFLIASLVFILPIFTFAAGPLLDGGDGGALGDSFGNIVDFIDSVIIPFILAIGFLVFVWGIFQFFILGGANEEAKESGKSLIMYAIAGFVIILGFWGIVSIISNGLNLEKGEITAPKASVK